MIKLRFSKVELMGVYGDDLMVVNAARVSFDNHHDKFTSGDAGLIGYLAQHNHWTPFAHPQATFRVRCPIPIARQFFKSSVGFTYSEVSRRYVSGNPEYLEVDSWRSKPTGSAKQGSGKDVDRQQYADIRYDKALIEAQSTYHVLLEHGVAPEQARLVLPQAAMTTFIVTGSLAAWARFCKQRLDPHAQKEIQYVARSIDSIMFDLFPFSWLELVGDTRSKLKGQSPEVVAAIVAQQDGNGDMYVHPDYKETNKAIASNSEYGDADSFMFIIGGWAEKNGLETTIVDLADYTDDAYLEDGELTCWEVFSKTDYHKLTRQGWVVVNVYATEDGASALLARNLGTGDFLENAKKEINAKHKG